MNMNFEKLNFNTDFERNKFVIDTYNEYKIRENTIEAKNAKYSDTNLSEIEKQQLERYKTICNNIITYLSENNIEYSIDENDIMSVKGKER